MVLMVAPSVSAPVASIGSGPCGADNQPACRADPPTKPMPYCTEPGKKDRSYCQLNMLNERLYAHPNKRQQHAF